MKPLLRHLLTGSLLALYASIALLSDGLHSLTPHGHHLGFHVADWGGCDCCQDVECRDLDGCSQCHDEAVDGGDSGQRVIATGSGVSGCHECEICAFLVQAVSETPQVAATPDLHPLVADLPCTTQGFYSASSLGFHPARGPPELT